MPRLTPSVPLAAGPSVRWRALAVALLAGALSLTVAAAPGTKARAKKATPARVAAASEGISYASRADMLAFAADVAARRDLDPEWTRQVLTQARLLPVVQRLVLPPASPASKDWNAYRARFVEPVRIRAGVAFWQAHEATLSRAEAEFGVPAEIIVGIIGVETLYGRQMGNFRVIDALATLALDFPAAHPRAEARQAFFRGELEQLLTLAQRAGIDPLSLRGSYAGAMGLGQFMPSSWVRHAIDFDGDGRVDLFGSPADAIGSVANYFIAHEWKPGLPTHYPVRLATDAQMDTLLAPDILPSFGVERFTALGARLEGEALAHPGPLALVELLNGGAPPAYIAGTSNFYAITRYNWSSYYAMAVIELGREVAQARAERR